MHAYVFQLLLHIPSQTAPTFFDYNRKTICVFQHYVGWDVSVLKETVSIVCVIN